jgi:hypothetical protein
VKTKKTDIIIVLSVLLFTGALVFIYRRQKSKDNIIDVTLNEAQKAHLKTMHKKAVPYFKKFIAEVEEKTPYKVLITSSYRTFERQNELYQQSKDNTSLKAAQAGRSYHNYGIGLDINLTDKSGNIIITGNSSKSNWEKTGVPAIAKKIKMRWGGDFANNYDPVHFDLGNFIAMDNLYTSAVKQYGSVKNVIGNQVNIA